MENNDNNFNNTINSINKKGDVIMNNKEIEMRKAMIKNNRKPQQKLGKKVDIYLKLIDSRVIVVKPFTTEEGISYMGTTSGLLSKTSKRIKIFCKDSTQWEEYDGSIVNTYKMTYLAMAEAIRKFSEKENPLNLDIVTFHNAAVKYYTAVKASKNSQQAAIDILATLNGRIQSDLVESATILCKTIVEYMTKTGKKVHIKSYYECEYDLLDVTEKAKAVLKDKMLLHFEGNKCTTVEGVSFKKDWHEASVDYLLRIIFINKYDKNGNVLRDDNGKIVKTPFRYVVERPHEKNGVLTYNGFVIRLWEIAKKNLPEFELTPEELEILLSELNKDKDDDDE